MNTLKNLYFPLYNKIFYGMGYPLEIILLRSFKENKENINNSNSYITLTFLSRHRREEYHSWFHHREIFFGARF